MEISIYIFKKTKKVKLQVFEAINTEEFTTGLKSRLSFLQLKKSLRNTYSNTPKGSKNTVSLFYFIFHSVNRCHQVDFRFLFICRCEVVDKMVGAVVLIQMIKSVFITNDGDTRIIQVLLD